MALPKLNTPEPIKDGDLDWIVSKLQGMNSTIAAWKRQAQTAQQTADMQGRTTAALWAENMRLRRGLEIMSGRVREKYWNEHTETEYQEAMRHE